MSTIEDFENAPVGATATRADGGRAMKIYDDEQSWITQNRVYLDNEKIAKLGFTLNPSMPTTAREALDLAWELAHEVKEGQNIPTGARYLEITRFGLKEYTAERGFWIAPAYVTTIRTVGPLSEPEWLDAPAVLAGFDGWSHDEREVFVPTGPHNHWTRVGSSLTSHWSDLRDVTPLYPKEGQDA